MNQTSTSCYSTILGAQFASLNIPPGLRCLNLALMDYGKHLGTVNATSIKLLCNRTKKDPGGCGVNVRGRRSRRSRFNSAQGNRLERREKKWKKMLQTWRVRSKTGRRITGRCVEMNKIQNVTRGHLFENVRSICLCSTGTCCGFTKKWDQTMCLKI